MRRAAAAFAAALAAAGGASGQEGFDPQSMFDPFEESDGLSSQPGDIALLRGLDKITASTIDFEAVVHQPIRFGSLTIVVRYCRTRPPEETPESFALMEVFDRTTDGRGAESEPVRIFSGWMFASDPALNPLEHPVYDVWPLRCRSSITAAPEAEGESR
ncbi:MAG: DUF2155 domain-containing protein [Caulobacterales bacterium]|nr:DUF2155 domain-containing protein [Caulobacterales bacterium]